MTDTDALRRLAIGSVLLAVALGVVSTGLGLAVTHGDLEAFTFADPQTILGAGRDAAPLWRWAMLLDMFFSYLLLLPLALFIHRRLRDRGPWLADIGLSGALAYIFVGGASAAILGIAGSSLIESHATAPAADQPAMEATFRFLRDAFYFGIWQTLDPITAGTWMLTTGLLLLSERRILGRVLVMVGVGFWLFALMTMFSVHSLTVVGGIVIGAIAVALGWSAIAGPRQAKAG